MKKQRFAVLLLCLACSRSIERFATSSDAANGTLQIAGTLADGTPSTSFSSTSTVTLTFTALSPGVNQARIANGADPTTGTLVKLTGQPVAWQLSDGDGAKTVSAQLLTADGASATVSATITRDTQAPLWRAFTTSVVETKNDTITFTYDAQDNLAPAADLQVAFSQSDDPACADGVYQAFGSGTATVTLSAPVSGITYVFNACVKDQAGNVSPFALGPTASTAARSVDFDDTPPAAPIINAPFAFAGGALVSWTDSNTDSQIATVDYSLDATFPSAATSTVTTSAGACLPTRVAPPTSVQLSGLDNFRTWYFRVHFTDCAGNDSPATMTSALIGVQSIDLTATTPVATFAATTVLWTASAEIDVTGTPVGNVTACDAFKANLRRCDWSLSDCTDPQAWSPTITIPLGGFFPDDSSYSWCSSPRDFACNASSDALCAQQVAPRLALAQTDDRFYIFSVLAGYPKNHGEARESTLALASCALTNDCTVGTSWSTMALDDRTNGTLLGAPAAVFASGTLAVAYTVQTPTGHVLSMMSCNSRSSDCAAIGNWSAPFASTAIVAGAPLEADATFAPTLSAVDRRIYVGVSADMGADAASACGHHARPAIVRCANHCSTATDITALPLDDATDACATAVSLAVTAKTLTAAWRAITPASTNFTDAVRVSTCTLAGGCDTATHFSAPFSLSTHATTAANVALASRVELTPRHDPENASATVRMAFTRPDSGEIFYAACDRSRSACDTTTAWTPQALVLRTPGLSGLSFDQIVEAPLVAITNASATPQLLLPKVGPPFGVFAAATGAGVTVAWQSLAGVTGSALVSAPIATPTQVTTLAVDRASLNAATLSSTTEESLAIETIVGADRSDSSQCYATQNFAVVSQAQALGDFGPMSTAMAGTTLYALSGNSAALSLYQCDTSSGCASPSDFTPHTFASGTNFGESDLASDVPRNADVSAASGAAHLVIAFHHASDLAVGSCVLASDGSCTASTFALPPSAIVSGADNVNSDQIYYGPSVDDPTRPAVATVGGAFIAACPAVVTIAPSALTPITQATSAVDVHYCGALTADPAACGSSASWQGATMVTANMASADAGSATIVADVKAAVHPRFGWLAAIAAGHGTSADTHNGNEPYNSEAHDLTLLSCAFGADCTQYASWTSTNVYEGIAAHSSTSTIAIGLSGAGFAPLALPDESRDYTAISFYTGGAGAAWRVAVCAEPSSDTDFPCRAHGWSTFALAPESLTPIASAVRVVNGDLQALFMSEVGITTATCPLGFDCAQRGAWRVQSETQVLNFAGFAAGISVGRSVPFATQTSDGHVYLSHATANDNGVFDFNFWSGGFATILR